MQGCKGRPAARALRVQREISVTPGLKDSQERRENPGRSAQLAPKVRQVLARQASILISAGDGIFTMTIAGSVFPIFIAYKLQILIRQAG